MSQPLRQPVLLDLTSQGERAGRAAARGQNFSVERLSVAGAHAFASLTEIILLLPKTGATLSGDRSADLPGHAIAILPAGAYGVEAAGEGDIYILATDRSDDEGAKALNAAEYASPDARVSPVGASYVRTAFQGEIRIHRVEDVTIPPDNGRLRFLQSETMSLNWVEYEGARDRSGLSPHSHSDAEQATLAIEGAFIHHLRTPWGRDAGVWQEDQHLVAGPCSVMVIPPEIIHTTEGNGVGHHMLIDVFAPPRADFIAKNWVFNAGEYAAPAEALS